MTKTLFILSAIAALSVVMFVISVSRLIVVNSEASDLCFNAYQTEDYRITDKGVWCKVGCKWLQAKEKGDE